MTFLWVWLGGVATVALSGVLLSENRREARNSVGVALVWPLFVLVLMAVGVTVAVGLLVKDKER